MGQEVLDALDRMIIEDHVLVQTEIDRLRAQIEARDAHALWTSDDEVRAALDAARGGEHG